MESGSGGERREGNRLVGSSRFGFGFRRRYPAALEATARCLAELGGGKVGWGGGREIVGGVFLVAEVGSMCADRVHAFVNVEVVVGVLLRAEVALPPGTAPGTGR
jgi:hypothetical protein